MEASIFDVCIYFQSFGLPALKVKPEYGSNIKHQEGPFGVPDPLVASLSATRSKLGVSHPLEASERNVSVILMLIYHTANDLTKNLYV